MTFNSNADVSGSGAKRRGPGGGAIAGGVGGLGAIAVILLSIFTGGDFTSLLTGQGSGGSQAGSESEISQCDTGADANANDDCRLAAGSLAINQFWAQQVQGYRQPQLIIVDGSTSTACGTASNATGPFYCPPEETVYIDPTFFDVMRQQFGADVGNLGQLYVLAHEYGHHIQQITGIFDQYPSNGTGPTSNGVRTELQADCFAGAWISAMTKQTDASGVPFLQAPTESQVRDALEAAAAVGDDRIQAQSGVVNPDTWTHGSSEQRQRWFATGYQSGVGACDTFAAGGNL
ncbi:MAG: neutral zinc metallopeptidase [Microbacterium sp. SCN 70-200]|uniref:KPN_02809 family neutral zinc metallopeptidase n=1 Tax=unclassified Microbacterium TaxID=2609290 RepID=UPI000869A1F5|nr:MULTISPECIES: neutral zinc metallopeptidase [unclassified Microbacterium]MBN9215279.1 neutral zinc metallopeptidase [Microbacterium sp.]ODT42685.1 MAG: neutral zinc metallopeptidase [Microbacterium sp. SCN 70-200]OJV79972.1 MAG: neutral zinc metallopeptidase [Microbacterium sp. 70-16]